MNKKIGIALSGGGVKALAGIGVLREFDNMKIKFSAIGGVSMGAIVGGMYTCYTQADIVEKKLMEAFATPVFSKLNEHFKEVSEIGNGMLTHKTLIESDLIYQIVEKLIPDKNIEDLPIEFCCVSTDIVEGNTVIMKKGSLRRAVMSSIALPGLFHPVQEGTSLLVDGGSTRTVPVEEVRSMGVEKVIAVEVKDKVVKMEKFPDVYSVIARDSYITKYELHKRILENADIVLSPAVKNIPRLNFNNAIYCIKAGVAAVLESKKEIINIV